MTAAALIVPGPPRNPVRLSDGRLVVIYVVDFYAKPPRALGGK